MSGVPRERATISKLDGVDDADSAGADGREIAGTIAGRAMIGPSVVEGSIFQISLGEGVSRGGVWATAGEPTVINSKIAQTMRWFMPLNPKAQPALSEIVTQALAESNA